MAINTGLSNREFTGIHGTFAELADLKGTAAIKLHQLFCRREYKPSIART